MDLPLRYFASFFTSSAPYMWNYQIEILNSKQIVYLIAKSDNSVLMHNNLIYKSLYLILTQHFTFELMFGCEKKIFPTFFPPNNKNLFFRCIQFILWCNVKNSISLEVAKGNFVSIFHWIWNLLKVCNFRFREWHAFYPIGANWIFASQSSLKIE